MGIFVSFIFKYARIFEAKRKTKDYRSQTWYSTRLNGTEEFFTRIFCYLVHFLCGPLLWGAGGGNACTSTTQTRFCGQQILLKPKEPTKKRRLEDGKESTPLHKMCIHYIRTVEYSLCTWSRCELAFHASGDILLDRPEKLKVKWKLGGDFFGQQFNCDTKCEITQSYQYY